jgi:hypothetical protein
MPKFYWNRVWGLGLAGELVRICSDDLCEVWTILGWKLYLGPLYISGSLRITPKALRKDLREA